jgi:hypothetical protein
MDAPAPKAAQPPERVEATPELQERRQWLTLPRTRSQGRRRTKRGVWRINLPTSLVVTLVGVALTAWLLPAFTRQWDDRQKAKDLKATLVTDIGASTAGTVGDAEGLWRKGDTEHLALSARAWTLAALRTEARLRSYFPPELVTAWQLYSYGVSRLLGSDAKAEWYELYRARAWLDDGGHLRRQTNHEALDLFLRLYDLSRSPRRQILEREDVKAMPQLLGSTCVPRACSHGGSVHADPDDDFGAVEDQLLLMQMVIIDDVLTSRVSGYSTTTRDLIDDLLPF